MTTFNQWAGGKSLDGPERFAFEAVYSALPASEAHRLLTDLFNCWIDAIEAERDYYSHGDED